MINIESFQKCSKCGMMLPATEFYKTKRGNTVSTCKSCYTKNIDDFDPITIIPLCKEFHIPYIKEEWALLVENQLNKLGKEQYKSVFGKYLAKMKLLGWFYFDYNDSPRLNKDFHFSPELEEYLKTLGYRKTEDKYMW